MPATIRRRDFLRGATGLAAAVMFPPSTWAGDPPCDLVQLSDAEFEALARQLSDGAQLVLPTNDDYIHLKQTWNAIYNPLPVAIVRVQETADVQAVVQWCVARGIHPRTRSGGHSFAGYSMGNTVIIDLRDMKGISLDGDGIATIGAGATLGQVYCTLHDQWERTMPAGSCPTVGISGITMAGGYGELARKYGMSCDVVTSAEIVLADGSARTTTHSTDEELFWSLRGGGSGSYGVVTNWQFETFDYEPQSYMYVWWDWSHVSEAFAAFQEWIPSLDDSYSATFSISAAPTPGFKIILFGKSSSTDFAQQAANLVALGPSAKPVVTGPNPLPVPPCTWPNDVAYGVQKSRFANSPVSTDAMDIIKEAYDQRAGIPQLKGTTAFILINALRGAIQSKPGDFNAFNHRDALISAQFGARWTDLGEDPVAQVASTNWQRDYYEAIYDAFDGGCYQGYWDPEVQNWPEMYYGSAFPRLRAAKTLYDPNDFFTFQRSIPLA
ncbi:MAG: FAD-dependent oxidoreductase [Phycisphaerales bacterium]|nr:FAD-dependent oxidoreductase [Phycisphaerales bacterium]